MSEEKNCKTCGAEIATNAKFCPSCGVKNNKPFYTKWWIWTIAGVIAIGVIGATGDNDTNKEPVNPVTTKSASSSDVSNEPKAVETNIPEVPTEYKSALKKAQLYGETMNMSKMGIYDQLTSEYGEKFSAEAAQYAIDNVQIDWKENALKKAEIYQQAMAMSPASIKDQLTAEYGEKFTAEEADYAIDNLK